MKQKDNKTAPLLVPPETHGAITAEEQYEQRQKAIETLARLKEVEASFPRLFSALVRYNGIETIIETNKKELLEKWKQKRKDN